ncbi:MAG TPA: hypothetical protein VFK09_04405 [Gemmatimonadales bacterium]|nr:hypothetical protein [Gemmatimonadales bacterium]
MKTAWDGVALARRFVQRLRELPPDRLAPALPPMLDRDPYRSAWTNVQVALGAAPPADRERLQRTAAELDAELLKGPLPPDLRETARRAVRAILARPWLETDESFRFVYQPFEAIIPPATLIS